MNADTEHNSIEQSGITSAEVESALATILADDKFAAAPQMSAFLAYVVKQTLLGEADRIKAYTVAVDALGKPASFDPQNDPSVRVLAKRLRSSLDQYYERTHGHDVIIELKSGSYKPRFVRGTQLSSTPVPGGAKSSTAPGYTYTTTERLSTGGAEHRTVLASNHDRTAASTVGANVERGGESRGESHTERYEAANEHADSSWYDTLGRIPRPVLVALATVALGWGVMENIEQRQLRADLANVMTEQGTVRDDGPIRIALASANEETPRHTRPALPTVYIPQPVADKVTARVAASIGSVMSRFDLIDVVRYQPAMSRGQWPEDYELSFSNMKIGDLLQLDLQLLHAPSGRVAHVESLQFPAEATKSFTDADLAKIESFAARLAHPGGPLIQDYRKQQDISPAIACLFDKGPDAATPADSTHVATTVCPETWTTAESDALHPILYRVRTLMTRAVELPEADIEATLQEAASLARTAVERAPYSGAAYAALMEVLHRSGQIEEALDIGKRAFELNPFNPHTLRTLANVMEDLDKGDDSARLRTRATQLDPLAKSS